MSRRQHQKFGRTSKFSDARVRDSQRSQALASLHLGPRILGWFALPRPEIARVQALRSPRKELLPFQGHLRNDVRLVHQTDVYFASTPALTLQSRSSDHPPPSQ